ncbi:MAG: hypothetical protein R3C02_23850 [Planctomycetaceae bacterium]
MRPPKTPVDADDHTVARLDEIDHACLHPGAAGAADGHREFVLGPKNLPQHLLGFIHDL